MFVRHIGCGPVTPVANHGSALYSQVGLPLDRERARASFLQKESRTGKYIPGPDKPAMSRVQPVQ